MPTLDNIKAVSVGDPAVYAMLEAGLNKMLSGVYFNATVVTKAMPARALSENEYLFHTPEFRALSVLNAVNYSDMNDAARLAIPGFIKMLTGVIVITPSNNSNSRILRNLGIIQLFANTQAAIKAAFNFKKE